MGTPLRGVSSFVPILPRLLEPAPRRRGANSSVDRFEAAPPRPVRADPPPPPIDVASLRPDTVATVEQVLQLEPGGLAVLLGSDSFRPEVKTRAALMIFELESRGRVLVPIATIEELAKSGASLDTVKSALGIDDDSAALIEKLEGVGPVPWEELDPDRRMDLIAKMYRHQNHLPAYPDVGADARLAKLKQLIDAEQSSPGFLSNLGDFALASLVNVVSDYVFFNASKWKDPSEHGGQAVSLAYRVYQVALQAYSSVWLGANHGTGTAMAFWWNQWNAGNDFGYYGVGALADGLGVRPEGWDGGPSGLFDDAHPPTWFSWTLWALTHPGEPTTGGAILGGALGSAGTTLQLLRPEANTPWRSSSGGDFWSKLGGWLAKRVPGRVF